MVFHGLAKTVTDAATGLVFAAFLHPTALNPAARAELAQAEDLAGERIAAVRVQGLAVVKGLYYRHCRAGVRPVRRDRGGDRRPGADHQPGP
jgi:DNA-binding IclR family transcriptional regulator